MNLSIMHGIAANIVGRAAFCALDFGTGTVAQYVPSCYDVWYSEWMRLPGDPRDRDEVAYSIKQNLIMIGFDF